MSRTTSGKSVNEIISEFLQGQRLISRSKGPAVYIGPADAERLANELADLLPKSSGNKKWVGYGLDRSTVLFNGVSKGEVKEMWQASVGAIPAEVRTVFSSNGIYRYSYTARDFTSYDVWIVAQGTEGFGE